MRFSENIIRRRDEFFGYITRRFSRYPQNGFVRAGVSLICNRGWVQCGRNEHRVGVRMREDNEFADVTLVEQHEGGDSRGREICERKQEILG